MVYASSRNMTCFECVDVSHKRFACPHKQRAESGGVPPADPDPDPGEGPSGQGVVKQTQCFRFPLLWRWRLPAL